MQLLEVFMRRNMGVIVLQIALAFFLLVSGVMGLMQSNAGNLNPVVTFLTHLLKNAGIAHAIIIAIAVCELVAGLFLLIGLFTFAPRIVNVILVLFIILWILNIALGDFIGTFNSGIHGVPGLLSYLQQLSGHLMVLGALICVQYRN